MEPPEGGCGCGCGPVPELGLPTGAGRVPVTKGEDGGALRASSTSLSSSGSPTKGCNLLFLPARFFFRRGNKGLL